MRCGAVLKRAKLLWCGQLHGAVNYTEPHRTDRKNRTVKNPGIFLVVDSAEFVNSVRNTYSPYLLYYKNKNALQL